MNSCSRCYRQTGFDHSRGTAYLTCFQCAHQYCVRCKINPRNGKHKNCQKCFEELRGDVCVECRSNPRTEGHKYCGTCYENWVKKLPKCTCGNTTGVNPKNGYVYPMCTQCRFPCAKKAAKTAPPPTEIQSVTNGEAVNIPQPPHAGLESSTGLHAEHVELKDITETDGLLTVEFSVAQVLDIINVRVPKEDVASLEGFTIRWKVDDFLRVAKLFDFKADGLIFFS